MKARTGSRSACAAAVFGLLLLVSVEAGAAGAKGRPPSLSLASVSVAEGQSATFVVRLSRSSTRLVRVSYRTAAGDATAGTDFAPHQGQLRFSPGQRSKQVVVPTSDDAEPEDAERFYLALSRATGATLKTREAAAIIGPSDLPPPFAASAQLYAYDRSQPGSGTASLEFDAVAASVSFTISVSGLPENAFAAHIHPERPPWRGPDALTLFPNPPANGTVSGVVSASRLMILEVFKNPANYAVHIHSSTMPARWLSGVLVTSQGNT